MKNLVESRKHDICFHRNGKIDITAHVARALGLREGDVLAVGIDGEDYCPEYYLYVRCRRECVQGRYEATCSSTVRKGGNSRFLRAYSKSICRTICDLVGGTDAYLMTGELRTDIQGTDRALTLITRTNLKPAKVINPHQ